MTGLSSLCQELLKQWPKVTAYLSEHTASQQMQGVRNQVISFTLFSGYKLI